MNRYQLAIKTTIKKKSFNFPATSSIFKISKYIKYCISHSQGIFNAKNIPPDALETAIIKVGQELGVPIIVPSKKASRVLSMAYSYDKIYSIEEIPSELYSIYYNCKPSAGQKAYTIIVN